jgi:hypothetical protein
MFTEEPIIQIRPLQFIENVPKSGAGTTILDITNPCNFDAYRIEWDVKYAGSWIHDWIRGRIVELEARGDERTNSENVQLIAFRQMAQPLQQLSGGHFMRTRISGSIPTDLCERASFDSPFPVEIKVRWYNNRGRLFEHHMVYNLVCTQVGTASHFSFHTSEIISQH